MSAVQDVVPIAGASSVPRELGSAPSAGTVVRLRLRRPGGRDRFVDGGWWPHSTDLTAELPALIEAVEAAGYAKIVRVSYHLGSWDKPPRKLMLGDRLIKLGGYHYGEPAVVTLVDLSGWARIDLVVVAPSSAADVGERALALAGADDDQHRAREILAIARAGSPSAAA